MATYDYQQEVAAGSDDKLPAAVTLLSSAGSFPYMWKPRNDLGMRVDRYPLSPLRVTMLVDAAVDSPVLVLLLAIHQSLDLQPTRSAGRKKLDCCVCWSESQFFSFSSVRSRHPRRRIVKRSSH